MDQKTSNFQVIILVVFSFFILLGVLLFATSKAKVQNVGGVAITPVVMWGTIPFDVMDEFIKSVKTDQGVDLKITYVKKDSDTIQQDLIESLASGVGPDIIILPQDKLIKNLNKITVLPYASYTLRDFKDRFIGASSVFLRSDGITAVPFVVDPLVMYWNKTHFINAGIVNPPTEWDEFSSDVSKLTKKDSEANLLQSGTALGEYQNIIHAKEILSTLLMQVEVPIVIKNPDDSYSASFYFKAPNSEQTAGSMALSFYTDFANPSKKLYSWNRSFKSSLDAFISGETSIYFGFASELNSISLKNPNLNFDVAKVPQVPNGNKKAVYSKMYGMAVLKTSKNQASAFTQLFSLVSKDSIAKLSSITNLPPVRNDALVTSPTDLYMKIFYDSAIMASTWADPDIIATDNIFKNMIESIISGKSNTTESVNTAEFNLRRILEQKN